MKTCELWCCPSISIPPLHQAAVLNLTRRLCTLLRTSPSLKSTRQQHRCLNHALPSVNSFGKANGATITPERKTSNTDSPDTSQHSHAAAAAAAAAPHHGHANAQYQRQESERADDAAEDRSSPACPPAPRSGHLPEFPEIQMSLLAQLFHLHSQALSGCGPGTAMHRWSGTRVCCECVPAVAARC